jgi:hypothetical protein
MPRAIIGYHHLAIMNGIWCAIDENSLISAVLHGILSFVGISPDPIMMPRELTQDLYRR